MKKTPSDVGKAAAATELCRLWQRLTFSRNGKIAQFVKYKSYQLHRTFDTVMAEECVMTIPLQSLSDVLTE
jgi:hypothetical protein